MSYDRAKHSTDRFESEHPTPEKEEAVLEVLKEAGGEEIGVNEIRHRTYSDKGVHIAHAHWLLDFLSQFPQAKIRENSTRREHSRYVVAAAWDDDYDTHEQGD